MPLPLAVRMLCGVLPDLLKHPVSRWTRPFAIITFLFNSIVSPGDLRATLQLNNMRYSFRLYFSRFIIIG